MGQKEKERLITCDRQHSSQFACVGAWKGDLRPCDKFNKKAVAAPICVQETTSYIKICDYKNMSAAHLCFPRELSDSTKIFNYLGNAQISKMLRTNIRACNDAKRRICLEDESLVKCGLIKRKIQKKEHTQPNLHFKKSTKMNNRNMQFQFSKFDPQKSSKLKQKLNYNNTDENSSFNSQVRYSLYLRKALKTRLNKFVKNRTHNTNTGIKYLLENSRNGKLQRKNGFPTFNKRKPSAKIHTTNYPLKLPKIRRLDAKYQYRNIPLNRKGYKGHGKRYPLKHRNLAAISTTPNYKDESQTKKYFYVVKCKDCDLEHMMVVDENAAEVIPEIETWTFDK
ncbi:uncharacterized protein TNCT_424651 [Trichonephila clavata]|uniref:Uncharacterized protein n=1 Tax=Trichonephila clavata TaxID=2740835 RepID=A0A8X6M491_TRICU|nr:uncharacterized protein TNCT_424651 [Trichonephila clavata]